MNREYAHEIISQLLDFGIAEFYVCAGARNFPLVETVLNIQSKKKIVFNHFEERSAAFYALGRIKLLKKPIAIITTSGSAVAELFPAVMEAYYSGLPLVLITADRPKTYRGTGAPQAVEQKNIFGSYVSNCLDLDNNDTLEIKNLPQNKPFHINVCFDVPLQSGVLKPCRVRHAPDGSLILTAGPRNNAKKAQDNRIPRSSRGMTEKFESFLDQAHNPVVIVSKICESKKSYIIDFLIKLNCPIYLESISNLRESSELSHLKIYCADKILSNAQKSNFIIDSVIKIGGTPTHRFWRDLDETRKDIKVFSIGELDFPGMPNAQHIATNLNEFFKELSIKVKKNIQSKSQKSFLLYDKESYKKLNNLIVKYPHSEQSFIYNMSNNINKESTVYLGNSLPIRNWDLSATYNQKHIHIEASRGVNGIDGQISTFLGLADESKENWGIFGDLTTLYDLAGPWMLQHRPNLNVNIAVINNSGGKIFNRVLQGHASEFCQNAHNFQFSSFAQMWNLNYVRITSLDELNKIKLSNQNILEIIPDSEQTELFGNSWLIDE